MSASGPRNGHSFSELVIGAVILGAALIPIYSTFVSSSRTVSSSRLAYMAMQVARETMEELRQIPFSKLEELNTNGFVAVGETPVFRITAKMRSVQSGNEDPTGVAKDGPKYPAEYGRIKYRLKIEDAGDKDKRLKKASLDVQWEEQGGVREKDRSGMLHFVSMIGYYAVDPEVPEP